MLSQFQDVLNVYLFPFVIAVPIAIVLYLLVTRRDEPPLSELNSTRQGDADSRVDTRFAPTLPPPYAAGRPQPLPPQAMPGARAAQSGQTGQVAQGPLSTVEAAALMARNTPATARQGMQPDGLPPMPPLAMAAQASDRPPAPTTLLLVDDSAVARAKLRKLFESAGYPVEVAKDGLEALELLGKNKFALMITDLEMPQMDGVELIAAVHGSLDTEDLPILAITGHDDLQAKVHECEGLFGIFKKPWNDRELLRRVETLVRLQSPSATA